MQKTKIKTKKLVKNGGEGKGKFNSLNLILKIEHIPLVL